MGWRKSAIAILLFTACLSAATAQSADEIVGKHLAATGSGNWKNINSIVKHCTRLSRGTELPSTITIVQGKGYRNDFAINGMKGYYIVTADAGWSFNPFRGQQKPDPLTTDMVKLSADRLDIAGPLVDYRQKGVQLTYLGTDDVEGTECYKIKAVLPSGKQITYFFDAGDYSMVRSIEKYRANGKEQVQTTTYGDYQRLPEGIVCPMSYDYGGSPLIVRKIECNVPVDGQLFAPDQATK